MPSTATRIVPLISSGTPGPLGVVHLPRLWTKLTLFSAGLLPEGYDYCGQGFDQMTIDALGLDRDRVIAFAKERKPTYVQFEQYVADQNGGSLSKATIEKHNAAITGYDHSDELGATMRAASGVKSDSVKDAVTLNTLEDLDELHAEVAS